MLTAVSEFEIVFPATTVLLERETLRRIMLVPGYQEGSRVLLVIFTLLQEETPITP